MGYPARNIPKKLKKRTNPENKGATAMILSKTSPKEKYEVSGSDIILHEKDLILSETLDCGQAFRWYKVAENTYSGYYLDTHRLKSAGATAFSPLKTPLRTIF